MKPNQPHDPSNPKTVEQADSNEAEYSGPDPEGPLIARARQGDPRAFRALVDLHRDRAFGLALRVLRSEPDAEEVAQDAFVRAWRALPSFRGESKFGTWLYAIVMRRALDRAAVLRTRRGRETGLDAAGEVAGETGEPTDGAVPALRMERLMTELSEPQRLVVTLFYYEGRSVDGVAAALRMPSGTVKTHLSRARATLRQAWLRHERREEA